MSSSLSSNSQSLSNCEISPLSTSSSLPFSGNLSDESNGLYQRKSPTVPLNLQRGEIMSYAISNESDTEYQPKFATNITSYARKAAALEEITARNQVSLFDGTEADRQRKTVPFRKPQEEFYHRDTLENERYQNNWNSIQSVKSPSQNTNTSVFSRKIDDFGHDTSSLANLVKPITKPRFTPKFSNRDAHTNKTVQAKIAIKDEIPRYEKLENSSNSTPVLSQLSTKSYQTQAVDVNRETTQRTVPDNEEKSQILTPVASSY
ncbi:hypothetical protein THRCLA_07637 [Thraustotheca clavata]|uniref:Uncharacterized protein n=1 Tax=Thraustotheca clavata TaxID=74557 RepID=A0A1V9ZCN2_9STRA|nr:hypothetical protein THRCLA_07637 [Thraustotheca clavata]